MKKLSKYATGIIIVCGILILVHGFKGFLTTKSGITFTVDKTTIYLIIIALVPFLIKFLESIKFGDFEATFKNAPVNDQIFLFLDGVAKHTRWTYYRPREGEKSLGEAFRILSQDAYTNNYSKFIELLSEQLDSDNSNKIWFASEYIGHYKIVKFNAELKKKFVSLSPNDPWPEHLLNCLWAYARSNDYIELQDLYMKTDELENIKWITHAYAQMMETHKEDAHIVLANLTKMKEKIETADRVFQQKIPTELKAEIDAILSTNKS